MNKKNLPLDIIFIIYFLLVIFISIHFWRKLEIIDKQLENKIITRELYEKKSKSIKSQFRFWGFIFVFATFILMILYSQWAY